MDQIEVAEREVVFGWGAIHGAPARLSNLGKRPMLLAGEKSARRLGLLDQIVSGLREFGCTPVVCEGIRAEPDSAIVDDAADSARAHDCDSIIGIGGGSVLDAAKAVAATVRLERSSWDLTSWGRSDRKADADIPNPLPIACIPTVAASGSEVNGTGVLSNPSLDEKAVFYHERLIPSLSIVDPALTVTVSPDQTWNGAMDILAHGIEDYLSAETPKADKALKCGTLSRLVVEMALRAIQMPSDQKARTALARLAMAVWTDNYSGPDTPWTLHAMAHVVGAQLKLNHSSVITTLLPIWIEFIQARDPDRLVNFGITAGLKSREIYWPREVWSSDVGELAQKITDIYGDEGTMPGWPSLTRKDIVDILGRAVRGSGV